MSIQLTGAVEEVFEKMRAEYASDEAEMNMLILSKWEMLGYGTADLDSIEQENWAFLPTSSREQVMRDLPVWAAWPHFTKYRRVNEAADEVPSDSDSDGDGDREIDSHADQASRTERRHLSISVPRNRGMWFDDSLRKPTEEQVIVEQQLLARSRKTVEFSSDDGSNSVDVIIDRSSIVDQRCFVKFRMVDEDNDSVYVALVPSAAEKDDLIVAVAGARELTDDAFLRGEEHERMLLGETPRRHFQFIGECLFNDFEVHNCVDEEDDDASRSTFVFH